MALYTDLIDPATLTGYARASLEQQEQAKGSLARWLPNRTVQDVVARFVQGDNGLIDAAEFRAYDAEPEIGRAAGGKRVTLELPALGQNIPISEYQQLRLRHASDDAILNAVQATTDRVVTAVANRMEHLRGLVLSTGRATITSVVNGQVVEFSNDDFGRDERLTITGQDDWSDTSQSRLDALTTYVDLYREINGEDPGVILASNRVIRALTTGTEFQTQLLNGGARPASEQQVNDMLLGQGLPGVMRYDRRVSLRGVATPVLPQDRILLLPAPGPTTSESGTPLGGTVWGTTLTAQNPSYGIEDSEQPGIVAGVYQNEKPPMITEVISDAIGLPVLANANLSMSVKVL
ncbi:major capsid protein [Kocuria sp.]|uniref:major capsid protein n=1 Tax=Kocuria sp. TaxID=1871328 RepID=UPI0026DF951A|nr:major capsid protein [Kocuria sp.]MDO5619277.1 major capsid protein [Kocuria sp.]